MPEKSGKVLVLGLDSAPPDLIFRRWKGSLPNLGRLMEGGSYGPLKSTIPPITCPAWMSMFTGKDPGRLGFYGFRNRKNYSYDQMWLANSTVVTEPTVWDIASKAGRKVIVIGVPQTYPPRAVNGLMVTSFLTPSIESNYTYPPELRQEIASVVGEYLLDVPNFRTENKKELLGRIYEMTDKRFKLMSHLMKSREWDLSIIVEMGPDRLHHGFWKYFDREHRSYEPGSPYESCVFDYYLHLDGLIGELLDQAGDASIIVVSDHGAKKMEGGICINEWLIEKGYLTLKRYPSEPTLLERTPIDWERTRAWASGGYYGRILLNVAGREPSGVIPLREYNSFRDNLKRELEEMPDHQGKRLGNQVYKPEEIYRTVKNVPPDLLVYFGGLDWRSVGSVGLKTIYTFENDTGPDDANHDQYGIFIMRRSDGRKRGLIEDLDIRDVASTILERMGLPIPGDMDGRTVIV